MLPSRGASRPLEHLRRVKGRALVVGAAMEPRAPEVRPALLRQARKLVSLPGCGHLPMWDGPSLIARTILEGASRRATPGSREGGAGVADGRR